MKPFTAIVWGAIALLFGLIVWAAMEESLFDAMGPLLQDRWFVVTLVDLYLGLAVFAAWALYVEPRRQVAAMWILSFACLGNLMTLGYLLWRARDASRNGGPDWAARFLLGCRFAPSPPANPQG